MFGPRFYTINKRSEKALAVFSLNNIGALVFGEEEHQKWQSTQTIPTYWIILGVLWLTLRFFFRVFGCLAETRHHHIIPSQPLDIHSPEHCTEWYLPGWYQPVTFPRCAGFWPIPGKWRDFFWGGNNKNTSNDWLVGGWTNPFEKYARQIGSFTQVGMKIKKYLKPPPSWLQSVSDLVALGVTTFLSANSVDLPAFMWNKIVQRPLHEFYKHKNISTKTIIHECIV